MIKLSREYLEEEYVQNQRSIYEIAEHAGTYSNKVLRALTKFNIPRRSHSEAQSIAIKKGRQKHPTRGVEISESIRLKISEGVVNFCHAMTEAEKKAKVLLAKQRWAAMSTEEREHFKEISSSAISKAVKEGSKLEKYLLTELRNMGYNVLFHANHTVSQERLQIDLLLPDLMVAIEVDGPSHFLPIWGPDTLEKTIIADHHKTGLLINAGYMLIRVKYLVKSLSKVYKSKVLQEIIRHLGPHSQDELIELTLN